MAKRVTVAVAGSRKTQGIVEHCAGLPRERRVLVLTYTQKNQCELKERLARYAGDHLNVEVLGWFTFLLRHFAKPFLPLKFPGERVLGFNFEGMPFRMATGKARFVDKRGAVYRSELGRLSFELIAASQGALIRRLEGIYDEILIDEVQDLSAYDWDIVDSLLGSTVDLWMVGDIRQSVLSTNARSAKNSKYAYAEAINWFRSREKKGLLALEESAVTWRCHPKIAAFSDSIFDRSWAFPSTVSRNDHMTGHDGVFLVRSEHVHAYVAQYGPQCLRHSVTSAKNLALDFMNFKVAKGATFPRVLIVPTSTITNFVRGGVRMGAIAASSFYVAVTRAQQSVAIVLDDPGMSDLPYWKPAAGLERH
ncbi:UvrD-helicase domain-containing protein [Burkholderia latens]|uniref:UvrD-helicase domain-containing protein n=1 Tax=Burkholderia latens TaxID=488446 RepID=UPI001589C73D|nr:UvrD-helicase domain-containing protein [Burkholderia latens]